jgi:hypothetical protein
MLSRLCRRNYNVWKFDVQSKSLIHALSTAAIQELFLSREEYLAFKIFSHCTVGCSYSRVEAGFFLTQLWSAPPLANENTGLQKTF